MEKKTKTALQEAKERMQELLEVREADLDQIKWKLAGAEAELADAKEALQVATTTMDLDAYEQATKKKIQAEMAVNMYAARANQLRNQEYITEEDSDKVLQSLDDYEAELASRFVDAIAEHIWKLEQILNDYQTEVQDVENTISKWTAEVHANYKSAGTIYAETGTNRSPVPLPFHRVTYTGCSESHLLADYLKQACRER